MKASKCKNTYKIGFSEYFKPLGILLEKEILIPMMIVTAIACAITIWGYNVNNYDCSAVVTSVGAQGVTVEYRDRCGRLRSDFVETNTYYNVGDDITIHVDAWKYIYSGNVLVREVMIE